MACPNSWAKISATMNGPYFLASWANRCGSDRSQAMESSRTQNAPLSTMNPGLRWMQASFLAGPDTPPELTTADPSTENSPPLSGGSALPPLTFG